MPWSPLLLANWKVVTNCRFSERNQVGMTVKPPVFASSGEPSPQKASVVRPKRPSVSSLEIAMPSEYAGEAPLGPGYQGSLLC